MLDKQNLGNVARNQTVSQSVVKTVPINMQQYELEHLQPTEFSLKLKPFFFKITI